MVIQNALCMPVYLEKDSYRVSLDNEKLRGKTINGILGLSSEGDQLYYSPYNENELLVTSQEIENLSVFLNLTDNNKKHFIRDLDMLNLISPPEFSDYMEIFINKKLDLDNSYISYKNLNNDDTVLILLYIFYQTRKFNQFDETVKGSYTLKIRQDVDSAKYRLSDFVDRTLSDKPINQIKTIMSFDDLNNGYLDLVGKNGERLENIPLVFLNENREKRIYFDGIKIDFEKSYLKLDKFHDFDSPYNITLTFIY